MSYLCPTRRYVSPRTMYLLQTGLGLILAAEIAAVCSLLFTFLFFPVLDVNWPLMLVCAALAGLLVGLAAWKCKLTDQLTGWRRVFIGIFGSIAAHPIVWILYAVLQAICTPQYAAVDPFMFVMATFGSLMIVGWITSLVGGFTSSWLLERRITFALEYETDEKSQGE